jgi:phosphoribosyl-ATP pyrophosphohydrolase
MTDNIIKDYTDLALKTELKDYTIKLIPVQFRKLHATMGISTEIAELVGSKDGLNTAEEIGDVFYYIAILCKVLNIEFDELLSNTKADCSQEVQALSLCIIWSGMLLDLSKKEIFYKEKIDDEEFIEILKKVVAFLQAFIHLKSLKLENTLLKNIAKLDKRYGGSFSTDKAINRDLEAELKILKSNN